MIQFIVAFIAQMISTVTAGTVSAHDVFYTYVYVLIGLFLKPFINRQAV